MRACHPAGGRSPGMYGLHAISLYGRTARRQGAFRPHYLKLFRLGPRTGLALDTMVDVERFRILLESERARKTLLLPALRADITSANAARQNSNVDDEHDPEGATIAFELSQAAALMQQSSATLVEVEKALDRIAGGSYGFCEICGEPIAEGRLEARPWTPYCIDHAGGKAGPKP